MGVGGGGGGECQNKKQMDFPEGKGGREIIISQ